MGPRMSTASRPRTSRINPDGASLQASRMSRLEQLLAHPRVPAFHVVGFLMKYPREVETFRAALALHSRSEEEFARQLAASRAAAASGAASSSGAPKRNPATKRSSGLPPPPRSLGASSAKSRSRSPHQREHEAPLEPIGGHSRRLSGSTTPTERRGTPTGKLTPPPLTKPAAPGSASGTAPALRLSTSLDSLSATSLASWPEAPSAAAPQLGTSSLSISSGGSELSLSPDEDPPPPPHHPPNP